MRNLRNQEPLGKGLAEFAMRQVREGGQSSEGVGLGNFRKCDALNLGISDFKNFGVRKI
jgi:hypothetical protein